MSHHICPNTNTPPTPVADMHWQQRNFIGPGPEEETPLPAAWSEAPPKAAAATVKWVLDIQTKMITETIKLWLSNPQVQTRLRKHHMHCAKLLTFSKILTAHASCNTQRCSTWKKTLQLATCLVMNKEQVSHWISIVFNFPLVDSLHDVSYKMVDPL